MLAQSSLLFQLRLRTAVGKVWVCVSGVEAAGRVTVTAVGVACVAKAVDDSLDAIEQQWD